MKDTTETRKRVLLPSARPKSASVCPRGGKTNEESSFKPKLGPVQDRPSHTSLSQLQAKTEAEIHEARKIINPLLDTEKGFAKELERYLSQWDVTQLRRRELLHKRWTEQTWFPLQRRVEERASSGRPAEAKRRQSLYNQFLDHCNAKGFVFLDTYDLKEYNPFLLNIKKTQIQLHEKPLYLQLHQRQVEKIIAPSCEAGCKCTKGHAEKFPLSDHLLMESVTSQAKSTLQASSNYPARKTPVEGEAEGRESCRLSTIPHHVRATATTDGRCHQTGCWFSRCVCRQQPLSLQQLKSVPTSK
ncbi:protein FAM228A isoform X2 [Anabas testudineus]|nr:protein FAM228A isoform X2 [Anabas testudineus]